MPLTPLRINAQSERDLLTICEQPSERLEEAYSKLAATKENIISPTALRTVLEQSLTPGVARALVSQLIALQSHIDHSKITASEAVGALSLGIKDEEWDEDSNKKWEKAAPIFEKFFLLDNIVITTKALELSFDFEHVLSSINILTDVRPVYSVNRDDIVGGIICNRMRVKFYDTDGQKSISIAMDKDEIEQLKTICDDALRKIELASKMLNTAGKLPSFIIGEEYE